MEELDAKPYEEVHFRGLYIIRERGRVRKERFIAASFTAWQTLSIHTDKIPAWDEYIKRLGLSDEPETTKEDLRREAKTAMENVQNIIRRAKNAGG